MSDMERKTKESCYRGAGDFPLHDQHFHRNTCISTDDYHKGKIAATAAILSRKS